MSKVTSTDVANLAKVSQSTVSAVITNNPKIKISEDTRKIVLDAAYSLGYLKDKITILKKVFVIIPTITNPFYTAIISYLSEILSDKNLDLLLCCTNKSKENEANFLKKINPQEILGIIYTFTPSNYENLDALSENIPIVILGESNYNKAVTVALDSYNSGFILAKHLYEKNHRNIAFVSPQIDAISLSRKLRLNGIKDFLKSVNVQNLLTVAIPEKDDEFLDDIEIGYKLANKILTENNNISAIIAVSDIIAVGAINAVKDLGLSIPDSISIASFDNIAILKTFSPSLTTIDHCLKERCTQAVEILFTGCSSNKITYEPNLIIRESTSYYNAPTPCPFKSVVLKATK